MKYTWGYIKNAILAKLDMDEDEATLQGLTNRFYIYANEVITQVSSELKPNYKHASIVITPELVGVPVVMPNDFIAWGSDVNYMVVDGVRQEYHSPFYSGYNHMIFDKPATYYISYEARWYFFDKSLNENVDLSHIPADILDCIPSYVAHQCYKIDDETKAAIFRQEYEMFLARLNDSQYLMNKSVNKRGW